VLTDILTVLPSHLVAVHAVCDPKRTLTAVTRVQTSFGVSKEDRLVLHTVSSFGESAKMLRSYGFDKESLPISLGGGWGIQRFVEWCELRVRFEWDLPPATNHKKIEQIFDFSNAKLPSELSEKERNERSRRMNVLHSRRKRERERIEIEVLQEQVCSLQTEQARLQKESKRLEKHLTLAQSQVMGNSCGFSLNQVPGMIDNSSSYHLPISPQSFNAPANALRQYHQPTLDIQVEARNQNPALQVSLPVSTPRGQSLSSITYLNSPGQELGRFLVQQSTRNEFLLEQSLLRQLYLQRVLNMESLHGITFSRTPGTLDAPQGDREIGLHNLVHSSITRTQAAGDKRYCPL